MEMVEGPLSDACVMNKGLAGPTSVSNVAMKCTQSASELWNVMTIMSRNFLIKFLWQLILYPVLPSKRGDNLTWLYPNLHQGRDWNAL